MLIFSQFCGRHYLVVIDDWLYRFDIVVLLFCLVSRIEQAGWNTLCNLQSKNPGRLHSEKRQVPPRTTVLSSSRVPLIIYSSPLTIIELEHSYHFSHFDYTILSSSQSSIVVSYVSNMNDSCWYEHLDVVRTVHSAHLAQLYLFFHMYIRRTIAL